MFYLVSYGTDDGGGGGGVRGVCLYAHILVSFVAIVYFFSVVHNVYLSYIFSTYLNNNFQWWPEYFILEKIFHCLADASMRIIIKGAFWNVWEEQV